MITKRQDYTREEVQKEWGEKYNIDIGHFNQYIGPMKILRYALRNEESMGIFKYKALKITDEAREVIEFYLDKCKVYYSKTGNERIVIEVHRMMLKGINENIPVPASAFIDTILKKQCDFKEEIPSDELIELPDFLYDYNVHNVYDNVTGSKKQYQLLWTFKNFQQQSFLIVSNNRPWWTIATDLSLVIPTEEKERFENEHLSANTEIKVKPKKTSNRPKEESTKSINNRKKIIRVIREGLSNKEKEDEKELNDEIVQAKKNSSPKSLEDKTKIQLEGIIYDLCDLLLGNGLTGHSSSDATNVLKALEKHRVKQKNIEKSVKHDTLYRLLKDEEKRR